MKLTFSLQVVHCTGAGQVPQVSKSPVFVFYIPLLLVHSSMPWTRALLILWLTAGDWSICVLTLML